MNTAPTPALCKNGHRAVRPEGFSSPVTSGRPFHIGWRMFGIRLLPVFRLDEMSAAHGDWPAPVHLNAPPGT